MATRTDSIALIRSVLQITGADERLTNTEIGERFDEAILRFSGDFAKRSKYTSIGNGNMTYRLPADWVRTVSFVEKIEYPIGFIPKLFVDSNAFATEEADETGRAVTGTSGNDTATLTTASDAIFYRKGFPVTISQGTNFDVVYLADDGNFSTGVLSLSANLANTYTTGATVSIDDYVTFTDNAPSASEGFVLHYSTSYVLTDSVDDVPSTFYNPLVNLASALCAYSISAEFGDHIDSTISADVVDYQAKSLEWRTIGENLEKQYNDVINKGDNDVVAHGSYVDVDTVMSDGRSWIFHNRLSR